MPRFSFWTLLNYYGEALRGQLHYVQVDSAEHEEDLHNALSMDEAMSMLMEAGFCSIQSNSIVITFFHWIYSTC